MTVTVVAAQPSAHWTPSSTHISPLALPASVTDFVSPALLQVAGGPPIAVEAEVEVDVELEAPVDSVVEEVAAELDEFEAVAGVVFGESPQPLAPTIAAIRTAPVTSLLEIIGSFPGELVQLLRATGANLRRREPCASAARGLRAADPRNQPKL